MSMENVSNSGPLPGPLASYDNTFSPRAGSLNAFSGPFSARNSTSSASSLPVIPTQAPSQSQVPSSSGLQLSSSGLCNLHGRGDIPVDWANIDHEVAAGRVGSGRSDRSTTGADTHTSDTNTPDSGGLWACEEFFGSQSVERPQLRPGQLSAQLSGSGQSPGQMVGKSALKNRDDMHGLKCMDPLLDALPRDLTEMAQGIATD